MSSEPRHLADKGDKSLLLGICPKLGAWDGWPKGKPNFYLVVFLDTEQIADHVALNTFAKDALDSGARYIMTAGTAAEDVEVAFDRAIVNGSYEAGDEVICTTSHNGDPMDEVLWESIFVAGMPDSLKKDDPPVLALFFGEDPRAKEYERLVSHLDETLKRVEDRPA
jgi:hypothetical protein